MAFILTGTDGALVPIESATGIVQVDVLGNPVTRATPLSHPTPACSPATINVDDARLRASEEIPGLDDEDRAELRRADLGRSSHHPGCISGSRIYDSGPPQQDLSTS